MANKRPVVGNEIKAPARRRPVPKNNRSVASPITVRVRKNIQTARNIVDPATVWPRRITKIHPNAAKYIPFFNYLAFDLFIVVTLGVIAAATSFINWAFLIYAVIVLVLRTDSQRMFSAALISLVIIPTATIANRTGLADNFAVMTFYFLLIGLIRAMVELKGETGRKKLY